MLKFFCVKKTVVALFLHSTRFLINVSKSFPNCFYLKISNTSTKIFSNSTATHDLLNREDIKLHDISIFFPYLKNLFRGGEKGASAAPRRFLKDININSINHPNKGNSHNLS